MDYLKFFDEINDLILYIPEARIDDYVKIVAFLDRIYKLRSIELKLDTPEVLYNDSYVHSSIINLILKVNEDLPGVTELTLMIRDKDFKLIDDSLRRKYLKKQLSRGIIEPKQPEPLKEREIIDWITDKYYNLRIDVSQVILRNIEYDICSDFEESLSFGGITCKKVYTVSKEYDEFKCKIEVYV